MGEPIELRKLPDGSGNDFLLRLRTDLVDPWELELTEGDESLPWFDEWVIIGCFVSFEYKRLKFTEAEELLLAARQNLRHVLEVRIGQAQRDRGFRA